MALATLRAAEAQLLAGNSSGAIAAARAGLDAVVVVSADTHKESSPADGCYRSCLVCVLAQAQFLSGDAAAACATLRQFLREAHDCRNPDAWVAALMLYHELSAAGRAANNHNSRELGAFRREFDVMLHAFHVAVASQTLRRQHGGTWRSRLRALLDAYVGTVIVAMDAVAEFSDVFSGLAATCGFDVDACVQRRVSAATAAAATAAAERDSPSANAATARSGARSTASMVTSSAPPSTSSVAVSAAGSALRLVQNALRSALQSLASSAWWQGAAAASVVAVVVWLLTRRLQLGRRAIAPSAKVLVLS